MTDDGTYLLVRTCHEICHTKVCLQIFALSAKKFARKSAYISYEHKL